MQAFRTVVSEMLMHSPLTLTLQARSESLSVLQSVNSLTEATIRSLSHESEVP